MNRKTLEKQARLVTKSMETLEAAPKVIAARTAQMGFAGMTPSTQNQHEFMRMGSEKARAFYESWNAMAAQLFRSQQAYMQSVAQEWWRNSMRFSWPTHYWQGDFSKQVAASQQKMLDTSLSVMEKGLDPVHRRAVANAKRLTGSKTPGKTVARKVRAAAKK
jgi:hypothetical protein